MADEGTGTEGTAEGAETDADGTTGGQAPPEEATLPDGVKKALAAARRDAREAEKARKALEAEVTSYKQRDMTDQQKLEQRATTAEKTAEASTRELNKIRAAMSAGLEFTDADLVTGNTEAEMKANAERLAERFGAGGTSFDGGARTTASAGFNMNDLIRRQRSTR